MGVGTALTSSWTQRGVRNEAPRQHSSWWWAVKWPVQGGLGAGRLSPDTRNSLYERIKSGALFSGPGNQGLRMLFCVEVPPHTHSPFFFLPLSHCWLGLCPHAWGERWMVEMGSGQTVLGEPSVLGWDPLELKN